MKISIASFLAFAILMATLIIAAPSGNAHSTTMSLRAKDPNSVDVLLGLNCRGSTGCGVICDAQITTIRDYVNKIGDNDEYGNGDQIACQMCPHCSTPEQTPDCPFPIDMGICVFAQNMKKDETIKGKDVKEKVARLVQHGCKSKWWWSVGVGQRLMRCRVWFLSCSSRKRRQVG
ncbi:hypothetical protein M3J09_010473 [Ascochyta lentis]